MHAVGGLDEQLEIQSGRHDGNGGGVHGRRGEQQSDFFSGRGEAVGNAVEVDWVDVRLLRHGCIGGGDEGAIGVRWRDGDGEKRIGVPHGDGELFDEEQQLKSGLDKKLDEGRF